MGRWKCIRSRIRCQLVPQHSATSSPMPEDSICTLPHEWAILGLVSHEELITMLAKVLRTSVLLPLESPFVATSTVWLPASSEHRIVAETQDRLDGKLRTTSNSNPGIDLITLIPAGCLGCSLPLQHGRAGGSLEPRSSML